MVNFCARVCGMGQKRGGEVKEDTHIVIKVIIEEREPLFSRDDNVDVSTGRANCIQQHGYCEDQCRDLRCSCQFCKKPHD